MHKIMSARVQSYLSVSTIKVTKTLIEIEVLVEVHIVSALSKIVIMSQIGIQGASTIEIPRT
jgi:hypothetical protein